MKICLICVEVFAWGTFGGFGKLTRTLGRELVRRGHDVTVVVPRRKGQGRVETLDGMTVLGYPMSFPPSAVPLLRACDADVYHSIEPSLATAMAMAARPRARHIVTFVDPRDGDDWRIEAELPSLNRAQVLANRLYEDGPIVRWAVRRACRTFATAHFQIPKATAIYGMNTPPEFLPIPTELPARIVKDARPTVLFLARLNRRKRPELFLETAAAFPEVRFVVMGRGRDEAYEAGLKSRFGGLPNIEWDGFVDPYRTDALSGRLGAGWILMNTAAREGLPLSFLEAAAHGCAILSHVDPDGFASRFGHHAIDDDFVEGLSVLLEGDRWRERGEAGRRHVAEVFEIGRAVDMHEDAYRAALGR